MKVELLSILLGRRATVDCPKFRIHVVGTCTDHSLARCEENLKVQIPACRSDGKDRSNFAGLVTLVNGTLDVLCL